MILLRDLRYVRLKRDLDASARFARDILGLEAAGCDNGARYFRSDSRDHTLVYFTGDPQNHATAFELEDRAALHAAGGVLESMKSEASLGHQDRLRAAQGRVRHLLQGPERQQDRAGGAPAPQRQGIFPATPAGVTGFSHIGLRTTDSVRNEAFWTQVMNASVSDRIGPAPLLQDRRSAPPHGAVSLGLPRGAAREPPGGGLTTS